MMDKIFADLDFVRCYLDDVVVFSRTLEENTSHLQMVFDQLLLHGLNLKLEKCHFAQSEVGLLGHVIDRNGVRVEDLQIKVIKDAKAPGNKTELRSFLGLAGYYRRFIKGFADLFSVLYTATS